MGLYNSERVDIHQERVGLDIDKFVILHSIVEIGLTQNFRKIDVDGTANLRFVFHSEHPTGVRNLHKKAARFLADTFALLSVWFITNDKERFFVSVGMIESAGLGITIFYLFFGNLGAIDGFIFNLLQLTF